MLRLAGIHTYPVKGLRGHDGRRAVVEPWGLAGDRRWMVVDADGGFLSQRSRPAMATIAADSDATGGLVLGRDGVPPLVVDRPGADAPRVAVTVWRDTVPARCAGAAAAAWLSDALDTACRLVWLDDPQARNADPLFAPPGSPVSFADGFPLLLCTEASLATLNRALGPGRAVPMDRFRPNLVVEGDVAPWAEERWRQVRVGRVEFTVAKGCTRCLVITVDQRTGARPAGEEPLRTLARMRRDWRGKVVFGINLVPVGTGTVAVGDPVVVDSSADATASRIQAAPGS